MITNAFLERTFDTSLTRDKVYHLAKSAAWCFDLHRVNWHGTLLDGAGYRTVCWFSAADNHCIQ